MATFQEMDRLGIEQMVAKTMRRVVKGYDPIMLTDIVGDVTIAVIAKLVGGGLEDSATLEVVDPVTGRFYQVPGLSEPGGTDVPRP